LVPGSQRWDRFREPEPSEVVFAEMEAGSVLIYSGSVYHGGGANHTDAARDGLLLHYAPSWLRQEENQYLSCPPEVAKDFSPELRSLIGYTAGFAMGFCSPPGVHDELVSPERIFTSKGS
jgi:ectoine hydroxylase-related dioxygenase (phytanoyl-CoA dioxygenase family)